MAKLLMNLRSVPEDEADEIRSLLDARKIGYYETRPSLWGVSGGGIWIRDDENVASAERLLAEYQRERLAKARAAHRAAKREGKAKSLWDSFRENPLQAIAVLLGIAFLIAMLALPFLRLGS